MNKKSALRVKNDVTHANNLKMHERTNKNRFEVIVTSYGRYKKNLADEKTKSKPVIAPAIALRLLRNEIGGKFNASNYPFCPYLHHSKISRLKPLFQEFFIESKNLKKQHIFKTAPNTIRILCTEANPNETNIRLFIGSWQLMFYILT